MLSLEIGELGEAGFDLSLTGFDGSCLVVCGGSGFLDSGIS